MAGLLAFGTDGEKALSSALAHEFKSARRGIHDTLSQMQRILVKKNCSYNHMLVKCVEQLYGKKDATSDSFSYYLANGTRIDITGGFLMIDDGTTGKKIPWTLDTFLKVTGKSASRVHFYCVEVEVGAEGNLFFDGLLKYN